MAKDKKRSNHEEVIVDAPGALPTVEAIEAPAEVTPTVEPVPTILVPDITGVREGAIVLFLSALVTTFRTIKRNTAGWWYMHAKDGHFGTDGIRFSHRVAVVDAITTRDDGVQVASNVAFAGLVYSADGSFNSAASWASGQSMRDATHAVRCIVSNEIKPGYPSTMPQGGQSPQCTDTRGATVTLYRNGNGIQPAIEIRGGRTGKGGIYSLSAILLADGTRVA